MILFFRNIVAIGLLGVWLAACSLAPPSGEEGIIPSAEQIRPDATTSPAVRRLVENARQASLQGKMSRAESFLERAIRIEPKNPYIWHYLARVQLSQGNYQHAEGLAAKSSSLIHQGGHDRLRADNWRIIAHARQSQGDSKGAQKAQARANALSSGNH